MNKYFLAGAAATIIFIGAGCTPAQPVANTTPPAVNTPTNQGNAAAMADLIVATSPTPGQKISSPVKVTGKARGSWYFEASFPVEVVDANGNSLGRTPAQALGEWMTTEFVDFAASVPFTTPTTATGTVILHKDNPSGLPENEKELDIPVTF